MLEAATALAAATVASTTRPTRSSAERLVLAGAYAALFDDELVVANNKWVSGDGGLVTSRCSEVDKRAALHCVSQLLLL